MAEGDASTGALPPPHPRQVEWKTAIRCALLVAGIAAALSLGAMKVDFLSPVSFLWILSGSMTTLGLYQFRRPAAWMDVKIGAHIGLVTGICLALSLGCAMAGWGMLARFGLHSMGSFDAQMTTQVQQAIQKTSQSSTPIPPEMLGFIKSPEFKAGMMLSGFAIVSAGLLVLSTLGGAFAGLLRMRRGAAV